MAGELVELRRKTCRKRNTSGVLSLPNAVSSQMKKLGCQTGQGMGMCSQKHPEFARKREAGSGVTKKKEREGITGPGDRPFMASVEWRKVIGC